MPQKLSISCGSLPLSKCTLTTPILSHFHYIFNIFNAMYESAIVLSHTFLWSTNSNIKHIVFVCISRKTWISNAANCANDVITLKWRLPVAQRLTSRRNLHNGALTTIYNVIITICIGPYESGNDGGPRLAENMPKGRENPAIVSSFAFPKTDRAPETLNQFSFLPEKLFRNLMTSNK